MSQHRRFVSRRQDVIAALAVNRKKGLEAAAITIEGAAKRLTPVDTGRLRASIAWAADGETRRHADGEVQYEVTAPEGTALIGTNLEYAVWVHENLNARHAVGQAKFLEAAARQNEARARGLIRKGLEGLL